MAARHLFSFFFCYLVLSVNISYAQEAEQPAPKLVLPIGNRLQVLSAQFSPDNKRIVTASADKSILVWDVASGSLLLNLNDHKGVVYDAEFSPDGKKIVSASFDNSVKVWDAETGKELFTLKGHKAAVLSAHFSPDGKKIVSVSADGIAKLWTVLTKRFVTDLKGPKGKITSAWFNRDGSKIVTSSTDNTARVWDVFTGKRDTVLIKHAGAVNTAQFSPDGKRVVTASSDNKSILWFLIEKRNPLVLNGHTEEVNTARFSPDGTKIVTASNDNTAIIYDISNLEKAPVFLKPNNDKVLSATFNSDGKKVCTVCADNTISIWDAASGHLDTILTGHLATVASASYSPDGTKLVTASYDGTTKLWDAKADSLLTTLKGKTYWAYTASFSRDGKKIITATDDSTAKIWDAKTGALLNNLKGHNAAILAAGFSPDGNSVITSSIDNTTRVWDVASGNTTASINGQTSQVIFSGFSPDGKKIIYPTDGYSARIQNLDKDQPGLIEIKTKKNKDSAFIYSAQFSPDGSKIITALGDSTAKIWEASTGKLLGTLKGHEDQVIYAAFSPDNKKIVTASRDQTAMIWDAMTLQPDTVLIGHSDPLIYATFSRDSKKIITTSEDKTARIWEVRSGKLLFTLKGHSDWVNTAEFDSSGTKILTASGDNTFKVWNANNGKELYTFFPVDSSDYLIVDKENHFDGTENARNLLYFTCGSDKISLDQVKGQLWVPDLAEKINGGKIIREKTLDQLDVCGLIPEVEAVGNTADEFQFTIKPLRGDLGEIVLYVNGIEVRNIKEKELIKKNDLFELNIRRDSLKNYFLANEENNVTLKAYTLGYGISSPEARITIEKDSSLSDVKPHLYALIVGTSQYKEPVKKAESIFNTSINLGYPAIDAGAISQTIEQAAKKMYGDDHVHMYNLTSDQPDSLKKPGKQNIRNALDSIGKHATANDILLLFLSGHGVIDDGNNNQQFYYMTADASDLNDDTAYHRVGISTAELTDWIRPKNILAQKRILILDACHSGQAINNLLGNTQQARPSGKVEDRSHMIKEIDKLNERSGLFILSASASNKHAFESDRYLHGYLTYSLLKAIKQQPDILEEGKNLNISRWFNAAGRSVNAMAKEEGNDQKTQIFSVIDFDIGEVDSSVISSISLKEEKPFFTAGNFQNADSLARGDGLGLTGSINDALQKISREADSKIVFAFSSPAGNTYNLSGTYRIKDKTEIKIDVVINKGTVIFKQFEEPVKGTIDKLPDIARSIAEKAVAMINDSNK